MLEIWHACQTNFSGAEIVTTSTWMISDLFQETRKNNVFLETIQELIQNLEHHHFLSGKLVVANCEVKIWQEQIETKRPSRPKSNSI